MSATLIRKLTCHTCSAFTYGDADEPECEHVSRIGWSADTIKGVAVHTCASCIAEAAKYVKTGEGPWRLLLSNSNVIKDVYPADVPVGAELTVDLSYPDRRHHLGIRVSTLAGKCVGFLRPGNNAAVANLLDTGALLRATVLFVAEADGLARFIFIRLEKVGKRAPAFTMTSEEYLSRADDITQEFFTRLKASVALGEVVAPGDANWATYHTKIDSLAAEYFGNHR